MRNPEENFESALAATVENVEKENFEPEFKPSI